MKRLLSIFAWTAAAYLGSAMLLGFLWGILLFALAFFHYDWSDFGPFFSWTTKTAPIVLAAIVLVLAVGGRLPGTKTKPA